MSTRLTKKGTPMVDSHTLQLVLHSAQVSDQATRYLSAALNKKGYTAATPATLNFLSTLECGINYAAEIARNLGVSRQMVTKTVKGLCHAGYLEQVDGVGKQKQIVFTDVGEQLISEARQLLARLDDILTQQHGEQSLQTMLTQMEMTHQLMAELNK